MRDNDTSGPAFPIERHLTNGNECYYGMSLRDWFAGMALQGIVASSFALDDNEHYQAMSNDAYGFADAMLEARKPTEPLDAGKDAGQ